MILCCLLECSTANICFSCGVKHSNWEGSSLQIHHWFVSHLWISHPLEGLKITKCTRVSQAFGLQWDFRKSGLSKETYIFPVHKPESQGLSLCFGTLGIYSCRQQKATNCLWLCSGCWWKKTQTLGGHPFLHRKDQQQKPTKLLYHPHVKNSQQNISLPHPGNQLMHVCSHGFVFTGRKHQWFTMKNGSVSIHSNAFPIKSLSINAFHHCRDKNVSQQVLFGIQKQTELITKTFNFSGPSSRWTVQHVPAWHRRTEISLSLSDSTETSWTASQWKLQKEGGSCFLIQKVIQMHSLALIFFVCAAFDNCICNSEFCVAQFLDKGRWKFFFAQ